MPPDFSKQLVKKYKHWEIYAHFVPRYAQPKQFMEQVFEDKLYGHNYKTDHSFRTPPALLFAVRDGLTKVFEEQK